MTNQDLAFVDLPDANDISENGEAQGPTVELTALQKGQYQTWVGTVVRTEAVLDETNRVTYAVARVEDPYGLAEATQSTSPLPMGTFVRARISGLSLDRVIKVPRSAFRGNDRLLFIDSENRLEIRTVNVIRTDAEYGYVVAGADAGERIALTAIEAPINGMSVRVNGDDSINQRLAAEGKEATP